MPHINAIIRFLVIIICHATFSLHACYVDFKERDLTRHSGIKSFYPEYEAITFKSTAGIFTSFDVANCDPLPIKTLETVRWFFSSAKKGDYPEFGIALEIMDSTISNIFVIRGKTKCGWSHIYFGYDASNPIFATSQESKKVYAGKILYVFNKYYDNPLKEKSFSACVRNLAKRITINKYGKLLFDVRPIGAQTTPDWRPIDPLDLLPSINQPAYLPRLPDTPAIGLSSTVYWKKKGNKLKETTK